MRHDRGGPPSAQSVSASSARIDIESDLDSLARDAFLFASEAEQRAVFHDNAAKFYRLSP